MKIARSESLFLISKMFRRAPREPNLADYLRRYPHDRDRAEQEFAAALVLWRRDWDPQAMIERQRAAADLRRQRDAEKRALAAAAEERAVLKRQRLTTYIALVNEARRKPVEHPFDCPLLMEPFLDVEQINESLDRGVVPPEVAVTSCGHFFDLAALEGWLLNSDGDVVRTDCPLCRGNVVPTIVLNWREISIGGGLD